MSSDSALAFSLVGFFLQLLSQSVGQAISLHLWALSDALTALVRQPSLLNFLCDLLISPWLQPDQIPSRAACISSLPPCHHPSQHSQSCFPCPLTCSLNGASFPLFVAICLTDVVLALCHDSCSQHGLITHFALFTILLFLSLGVSPPLHSDLPKASEQSSDV